MLGSKDADSAVRDADNRLVAIEGILTDITERKRAESELAFSHILLTTAIENSPDAILVVDANRSNHHVQPAFRRAVGHFGRARARRRSMSRY